MIISPPSLVQLLNSSFLSPQPYSKDHFLFNSYSESPNSQLNAVGATPLLFRLPLRSLLDLYQLQLEAALPLQSQQERVAASTFHPLLLSPLLLSNSEWGSPFQRPPQASQVRLAHSQLIPSFHFHNASQTSRFSTDLVPSSPHQSERCFLYIHSNFSPIII